MKTRKPLSTKIPPEPHDSHQLIKDWMAYIRPSMVPLIDELDTMIRGQIEDARYSVKWGSAFYGSPDTGWCIELAAYHVSVNIVFLNGDQLEDPPELGGETRYVKLRNMKELHESRVSEWINESAHTPGWAWD